MPHQLTQVDVFSDAPLLGNPVAVVHDADDLDTAVMQRFATWLNLAETTFLLAPTAPAADYRVRIFTPERELPFAGHPTLGSARAWLVAAGDPPRESLVQQCAAGPVTLRRDDVGRWSFAAPPLVREGPVDADDVAALARFLGVTPDAVLEARWIDNGPGWVGVRLADARTVLDLRPAAPAPPGLRAVGVVGPHPGDHPGDHPEPAAQVEVRAFVADAGPVREDPVTGSLHAGLAPWLVERGVVPSTYVAAQGTALGRRGRVHVRVAGGGAWIGGDTTVVGSGAVALGGRSAGSI